MDFSEELWWQNLIEWIIDEGKIVTFKTLAGTLNVHVNMAKKMLATFYQGPQQDKISAFYLIIGQLENNNGLSLQVVAEKDVKRTEASLKKITSKHIFALCRSKMDMSTADILQALEEINQDPNQMIPLRAIKNGKIKMTAKEERESTEPKTKEKVEVKPEPDIEFEDNKNEDNKKEGNKKEDNKKEDNKKEDNKKENNKKENKSNEASKVTKKGGGGSIAAMFAKAPPPKPKKPKEEPADSIPSPLVEEPSKDASQTKVNSKKREKPALKSNKKHKRIRMMSSSEDDEEDSTSENEKEEKKRYFTATEPESPEKEEQEDKENDEEVVLETPKNEKQDAQKRRRGRKLVNKTFLDDSGFMVTKKEYASCSESEEEEAKKSASQPKSKIPYTLGPSAKKPKSSEKSNEEQQSQPRKQATIKNFFTRK